MLPPHLLQHHHCCSWGTLHVTEGPHLLFPATAIVEAHLEDGALQSSSGLKPDEEAGRAQAFPPGRQATVTGLSGLLGLAKLSVPWP